MFEIAKTTIKEFLRMKLVYIGGGIGVLLILFSYVLDGLTINQGNKVIVDFSLSMIEIFSLILTLFLGAYMLYNEFTKKTILLVLSKLDKKYKFILGKFFGFSFILFLIYFVFTLAFIFVLFLYNLQFHFYFIEAIILSYLKILVVLAMVLFFSTFVSPFLALFSSLTLYFISHSTSFMYFFSKSRMSENISYFTKKLIELLYYILPNFQDLSMKEYFLSPYLSNYTNFHFLLSVFAGAVIYIVILLFFASVIFSKKEF